MILGRGGKNIQKNYTKKDLHDPDNHDGVITHLAYTVTNTWPVISRIHQAMGTSAPGTLRKVV